MNERIRKSEGISRGNDCDEQPRVDFSLFERVDKICNNASKVRVIIVQLAEFLGDNGELLKEAEQSTGSPLFDRIDLIERDLQNSIDFLESIETKLGVCLDQGKSRN